MGVCNIELLAMHTAFLMFLELVHLGPVAIHMVHVYGFIYYIVYWEFNHVNVSCLELL